MTQIPRNIIITIIIMMFFSGDSQSVELLNHSGYIGSLTTNVLLLIVVAIYLAFR